MASLQSQLEELEELKPNKLRPYWREVMRLPAPDIGPDLMRRAIAYRLQERAYGKPSRVTAKKIERLGLELARKGQITSVSTDLKPGMRLTRSWHGKVHQILVCDDGFEYGSRRYRSLSQIAREITGAHWSGPRFFGLTSGSNENG